MLIYILLLSILFVVVSRVSLRIFRHALRYFGVGRRRVIFVGPKESHDRIINTFQNYQGSDIAFIDHLTNPTPQSLCDIIKEQSIDEVVIDNRDARPEQMTDYFRAVSQCGAVCHLIPNTFEVQASNVLFNTIAEVPVLTLRPTPLEGWGRIVKRVIDIIISTIALIILSPLFLLTVIMIKLTDPGPAIYVQPRVARGLKKFTIYKFRTMRWKYCTYSGPSKKTTEQIMIEDFNRPDLAQEYRRDRKIRHDPRISPIGKFLRRTNIDELPQLMNVLRGDISLVGPRPYLASEIEHNNAKMLAVFTIKPGMTGPWQVSGRNEASFDERIRLDYYYVQNWSLWHDAVIVSKTILTILTGSKGAY